MSKPEWHRPRCFSNVIPLRRLLRRYPGKVYPMDDESSGWAAYEHCGAVWDERHEQGKCGVIEAMEKLVGTDDGGAE